MAKVNQPMKISIPAEDFLTGKASAKDLIAQKIAEMQEPWDLIPATNEMVAADAVTEMKTMKSFPDFVSQVSEIEAPMHIAAGTHITDVPNLGWITYMNSDPVIPLLQALSLYQPVRGTSSDSRYFVVGIGEKVKIACRLMANTASIRVEGPGLSDSAIQARLESSGFGMGANHASLHVKVTDPFQFAKVVGSILGLLGDLIGSPVPNLMLVASASGAGEN